MPADLKNVLIVGLGLAGVAAAKSIAAALPSTHRVVALSEKDFAYYPVGSLRAATVPGELPSPPARDGANADDAARVFAVARMGE